MRNGYDRKSRLRGGTAAVMLAALLAVSGCRKSPESPIVQNKDFDNMIDEAQDENNGVASVSDAAPEYDTYTADIQDDDMHVKIHADAAVEIPEADTLSVYRVKQTDITDEFFSMAYNKLVGDTTLYDGSVLSVPTKADIETEISGLREQIEQFDNETAYSDSDKQAMTDEYQSKIDELQAEYENAPDEIDFEDYPYDIGLKNVSDLYNADTSDGYYSWLYSLNSDGQVYYGVSDGSDGTYMEFYAQNNASYGNCIKFRKSTVGYEDMAGVMPIEGIGANSYGIWNSGEEPNEEDFLIDLLYSDIDINALECYEGEEAGMSEDEAKEEADALLEALGLTDYECYENGLYNIMPSIDNNGEDYGYCEEYAFRYLRSIDGVFVNNDAGAKLVDEWQGDTYNKQMWGGESIIVYVNDNGITGFDYSTPIEVTETVVDGTQIKTFEDIKPIFEEMAVTMYADIDDGYYWNVNVDSVVLRYTRISEADSFDTGLLVPVWEFTGSLVDQYGYEYRTGSVMQINAIDGTVIDTTVGY